MSDVPLSLTDLKIAIGTNIMSRELMGLLEDVDGDLDIEVVVVGVPDDELIDSAETWRATYPEVVKYAMWVAERALPYVTDKVTMFANILHDASEATELLSYYERALFVGCICPVLQKVQSVETTEAVQCLEALAAFGRGE
jgi:hypothetical protein